MVAFDLARIHSMVEKDLKPSMQRCMFALCTRLFQAGYNQDDIEYVVAHYLKRRGAIRNMHAYYSPDGSNLSFLFARRDGNAPKSQNGRPSRNEATPLVGILAKQMSMEVKP